MWAYITSWFTPTSLFLITNLVVGTIVVISRFSTDRISHHDHFGTGNPAPLARAPSLLDRVKSINFSVYKFEQPDPQTETQYRHDSATEYTDIPGPPPLARAPSLLERVKSINFPSFNRSDSTYPEPEFSPQTDSDANVIPGDPPQLSRAPSLLERVKSISFPSFNRPDPSNPDPEFSPQNDLDTHLTPDASPYDDHSHVKRSKSETIASSSSGQPKKMKKSTSEKSKMALHDEQEEDRETVEKRRTATTRIEKTVSISDEGVDAQADDFINRFKQQLRLQRLDSLLRYKDKLKGK